MEYLIGLLLAVAVVAFSALIGLDRERSFYATVLIVEILAASVFCVLAVCKRWNKAGD